MILYVLKLGELPIGQKHSLVGKPDVRKKDVAPEIMVACLHSA